MPESATAEDILPQTVVDLSKSDARKAALTFDSALLYEK